jgi:PEP-CTERM motif
MRKFGIALVAAGLLFSAGPAVADGINDTFSGVVASDSTVDSGYFGGGNLAGEKFTLAMTLDPSVASGQTFITGGITGTLTISGFTQVLSDSSFGFLSPVGGGVTEVVLEAFTFGGQAVGVDLNANIPIVQDLGVALPSMRLSKGDFSNNAANFTDASGENLDLTVKAVNVPEPGSLTLLAAGLIGLVLLLRRNAA